MRRHPIVLAGVAAIIGLLALSQSAASQDTANVVRIAIGNSVGSGVYLGDRLVLSCAHLFREEDNRAATVTFPGGEVHGGATKAIDWQWDQSLIELADTPRAPGACIASANPVPGDTVTAMGYAHGRELVRIRGTVVKYVSAAAGQPGDWFELSGGAQEGCSGGPVFDASGCVLGNLWGTRSGVTVAVMCGRTQRFLFPWNARLEAVRLAQCANGRCLPPRTRIAPLPPRGQIVVAAPPQCAPATTAPPSNTPIEVAVDYDKIVDLVIARLKADPSLFLGPAGPAGPSGPPGPVGPPGPSGADGQATAIDTAALAEAIKTALPGITVRTIDGAGKVLDSEHIPLGGTLNIIHKPLTKR